MILVDKHAVDLVTGYEKIHDADRELPIQYKPRLLSAYAHRRQAYDAARAVYQKRTEELKTKLQISASITVSIGLLGLLVVIQSGQYFWLALLVLVGLLGAGLMGSIWSHHVRTAPLASRL
jgi:F0F1-type ATP synthase membrane subunit c/vacuolar-type H+-ATPase subunit K